MDANLPVKTIDNGNRNAHGHLLPGHKVKSGGNPINQEIQKFRQAFYESLKTKDVHDVVAAMMRKAKGGDVKAASLILNYIMGKPLQTIEMGVSAAALTPAEMVQRLELLLGIQKPNDPIDVTPVN